MLNLDKIKRDHEIATEPVWWGRAERRHATARALKQIPALVAELREARAEIECLRILVESAAMTIGMITTQQAQALIQRTEEAQANDRT